MQAPHRGAMMHDSSEKMTALVQLAGTVAHELNNIFTAVSGNISLLHQDGGIDADQATTIRDIVRAAQRGIDLTSKLQAFAGRQRLDRKPLDINATLSRTMRELRHALSTVAVRTTLAEGELVAYLDEEKFVDTVKELIKNACAAMPSIGGRLVVETWRKLDDRRQPQAVLRVSDNGNGMPPEIMARAMEPLFTTNPRGIHAGWGLSYCVGFIRQCGGRMTLHSEPGKGTVIDISLPLDTL